MLKKRNITLITLHSMFWILSFTQGIFQLYNIPSAIYKVGIPVIVSSLLIIKLLEHKKLKFIYLKYIIAFILVSIISFVY